MQHIWVPDPRMNGQQLYQDAIAHGLKIDIKVYDIGKDCCMMGMEGEEDRENATCVMPTIPKNGCYFTMSDDGIMRFFCKYHFGHLLRGAIQYQKDMEKKRQWPIL